MTGSLLLPFSLVLAAAHLASCLIVLGRRREKSPAADRSTFVTLLRPVCGLDQFDARTLESSFHLDWPDYEVIFCAAEPEDPAIPLLSDLIARYPGFPAGLLVGEDRISGNPKLNNLAKGWRAARGDRIVMADANLLLPRDYLDRLLAMDGPGVGLISSPPIGTDARSLWGEVEIAFLNGNQARLQLFADSLGHGFAQGKTLMWSKDFLEANGGLRALGRFLAEDVAATRLVRAAGRRVRLSTLPFQQPVGVRDMRSVWMRQLRWSKVRRDGFPALFLAEPLNGAVLPVIAAAVAAGPWVAGGLAIVLYGSEVVLCRRMGWPVRPVTVAAMVLRDAMIPLIWIATFRSRDFVWRGTSMQPVQMAEGR